MACVWLLPQELNLILTRTRSGIWLMMDFDPDKIINLKLPSGRAIGTPVRSVQYNSFVVIAVSKALRLAVAASAGATLLTVPFMLWLSNVSRRRANAKLERTGCGSVSFDVTDGEL